MSNPTLSWAYTAATSFTIAGANPTVAEVLAAMNSLMSSSTLWVVSNYSAVNGTLELKRSGSPAGELGTVRFLAFGGSAPNAAAISVGHTAGASTGLYAGLSVDAATTGPGTAYTAGAPYSTKYVRAGLICTPSTQLTTADTVRLTLFESADALGFVLGTDSVVASICWGRIITLAADDSLAWACMPSGGTFTLTANGSTLLTSVAHPLPPFNSAGSNTIKPNYWDTVTAASRFFGRLITSINASADTRLGAGGTPAALLPVPIGDSVAVITSNPSFIGFLRQIRLGPAAAHRVQLRNGASVLQGTHMFGGSGTGIGMWLDEVA